MRDREVMTMTEAAAALGVSVPTVRQMIARGLLSPFRTPGGHLRFTTESLRAAKGESAPFSERSHGLSHTVQNRRERVEELGLQAQELRAQHELDSLRREQEQEEADRRADAEALRQERREDTRTRRINRERLTREEDEEQKRKEAAQESEKIRACFISTWLSIGLKLVPVKCPPEVRLQAISRLKQALSDCPHDELQALNVVAAAVADTLVPWRRQQEIARIVEDACAALPPQAKGFLGSPSEWDLMAQEAAFSALSEFQDETCSLERIRMAVRIAVNSVIKKYEVHHQTERQAEQKAHFLERPFLSFELSSYVHTLLDEELIELEPGEEFDDVIVGLESRTRKYLHRNLTGRESREEVKKLLHEFVRAEFEL